MTAIQEFWLVAFGVAERTAISPPAAPACSRAILARDSPMPSVVGWLMKMSRQSLEASESQVTTLIFAARAWFSDGQTAFGSFAAITMTSCCCWISVLMYETCDEAEASFGPTSLYSPLSSPTATLPPPVSTSEYGLFSCLGRYAILRPVLSSAFGLAEAPACAGEPVSEEFSLVVPPHAVTARASSDAPVAATRRRAEGRM